MLNKFKALPKRVKLSIIPIALAAVLYAAGVIDEKTFNEIITVLM